MKVLILYRPESEYSRSVDEFIRDFRVRNSEANIETLNIDTREGSAMASIYDIWEFPTIMAMTTEGAVLNTWQGSQLPLIDEVAAYARS